GERAERETENRLTKLIHGGNQSVDDYIPEIDEPSSSRALPSMNPNPSLTTLPKQIPSPVPAPASTVAPSAAPAPVKAAVSVPEQNDPEVTIPKSWSVEERAKYQKKLLDEVKELAQQLKTIAQLRNPNPSSTGATPQKKAA
ncbi:MAG: hypothetical protein JWM04_445, partial [Verrucomicrobiales bacterium]|nr:hypothetical protein [Verrucomicrobiales bacterium]